MATAGKRYTTVAILLHWAIAIGIVWQILLGLWMSTALDDAQTRAQAVAGFQIHKSVGLTILALSLVRLGWRLLHAPPSPPAEQPAWERWAARATHWAFYALMIGLPLSGWAYASTGWSSPTSSPLDVPTVYFGLVTVPHLPGLATLAEGARAGTADLLLWLHANMAWVAVALLVLHVGAALKHQFVDRDEVLGQMVPGVTPRAIALPPAPRGRVAALALGFAAIALFFVGASLAIRNGGAPDTAGGAPASSLTPVNSAAQAWLAASPGPVSTSPAPAWQVDRQASSIRFAGTHADVAFDGAFGDWAALIRFDPANPAQSAVRVAVATASARDGIPLHDRTLPQAEWFDSARHPIATFTATQFRKLGGDRFEATGVLAIKGRDLPVTLPFELKVQDGVASMSGEIVIKRRGADLGQSSDPRAEWVSEEIRIRIKVKATRNG